LDDPIGAAEGIDPHDDDLTDLAGETAFDDASGGSVAEGDRYETGETPPAPPAQDDWPEESGATPTGLPGNAGDLAENTPANPLP
jgi:hypothetical protein